MYGFFIGFLRLLAGLALAFAIFGYVERLWTAAVGDSIIFVAICVGLWLLARYRTRREASDAATNGRGEGTV
jgi:hypothetical protein